MPLADASKPLPRSVSRSIELARNGCRSDGRRVRRRKKRCDARASATMASARRRNETSHERWIESNRKISMETAKEISMGAVQNRKEMEKKLRRWIGPLNGRGVEETHALSFVFVEHGRCVSDGSWSLVFRRRSCGRWDTGERRGGGIARTPPSNGCRGGVRHNKRYEYGMRRVKRWRCS